MKPKVTVLLPTYNAEDNVERAICSILEQTYGNLEVMVVDDESDDQTQEIVKSLDDDRINLQIRTEGEKGLTQALNYGIEKADGKYVARQDADDWSHKDRIETQVDYAEENEVDIVGTGSYNMNPSGDRIGKRAVPERPNPTDFNSGSQFVHGSLMMR